MAETDAHDDACACCGLAPIDCECIDACGWDHLGRLRAENAALHAEIEALHNEWSSRGESSYGDWVMEQDAAPTDPEVSR